MSEETFHVLKETLLEMCIRDSYGLFHYSATGDEDSARLAVLPGAVGTSEVAKNPVKALYLLLLSREILYFA